MMTLATIRVLISYNTFDVLWNFCKESVCYVFNKSKTPLFVENESDKHSKFCTTKATFI